MQPAKLEHVNITVSNPKSTADMLRTLFGWHIRWEGPSMDNGYTVHVGNKHSYVALYAPGAPKPGETASRRTIAGLNHIAVTVEDLDAAEKRIVDAGFKTENHADYEPGRRFYFYDRDNVEYEVVSYVSQQQAKRNQVNRRLGRMSYFSALIR